MFTQIKNKETKVALLQLYEQKFKNNTLDVETFDINDLLDSYYINHMSEDLFNYLMKGCIYILRLTGDVENIVNINRQARLIMRFMEMVNVNECFLDNMLLSLNKLYNNEWFSYINLKNVAIFCLLFGEKFNDSDKHYICNILKEGDILSNIVIFKEQYNDADAHWELIEKAMDDFKEFQSINFIYHLKKGENNNETQISNS